MAALASGDLNRRVEIRRATMASDGHGGQITTWSTISTVRAAAYSQNGREGVISGALQGVAVYRLEMRWRADLVRTGDQLRMDGRDYNVRTVADPDGRREKLVILADTAGVES
jgi:SPP1 family predicted phage head-tail adaptor